jgi:hypothetical protein
MIASAACTWPCGWFTTALLVDIDPVTARVTHRSVSMT